MEAKNKLLASGIYRYLDNDVVSDCVPPIKSLFTSEVNNYEINQPHRRPREPRGLFFRVACYRFTDDED